MNLPAFALPSRIASLFSKSAQAELVALRHDLHQHPELSLHEHRTAARLYAELEKLHPLQLARVAGTGIVARLRGKNAGAPLVAIRGDIDALPIQEETGLPWASMHSGVMHACGHDVHASWAIGAAQLLTTNPAHGDVLIVLQPAEELGKGATALLECGVLEGVAAIFGAHVDRRFEIGEIVAEAGPLAAAADTFEIELLGKGAHGARPHETCDPIVGAGALIGALQTIVARRLNPAHAGVVSIGTINAGTASNIIPARAKLTGTLRATTAETRTLLHTEVKHIAENLAAAYALQTRVRIEIGTPPLLNDIVPTRWAQRAVQSLMGEAALVPLGFLNMAGEDFAFYLEKIAGCFLRIGAREPGGVATPAHAPHFYPAEESIFIGAAVLAEAARVASAELQ
ncbi:amidohydrolase [candidate division KSB1 bacterium]|nr:amidohydrolase [candidate division KSB1 bacterium]